MSCLDVDVGCAPQSLTSTELVARSKLGLGAWTRGWQSLEDASARLVARWSLTTPHNAGICPADPPASPAVILQQLLRTTSTAMSAPEADQPEDLSVATGARHVTRHVVAVDSSAAPANDLLRHTDLNAGKLLKRC